MGQKALRARSVKKNEKKRADLRREKGPIVRTVMTSPRSLKQHRFYEEIDVGGHSQKKRGL